MTGRNEQRSVKEATDKVAAQRRRGLEGWDITGERLQQYNAALDLRVLTHGSNAGERVHLLRAGAAV
jgi:hypothetical protein